MPGNGKFVQGVLFLARRGELWDRLIDDARRHGWEPVRVTGSSISAQQFVEELKKMGKPDPLVFLVADSDADVEHFAPLIQRVLRPRQIFPVVLRTNEEIRGHA